MQKIIVIVACIMMLILACCKHQHSASSKKTQVVTVESIPFVSTAYYSGTIQPFKSIVITSPADGVIEEKMFHYGDNVKAGQLLFSISSEKFISDYKTAMMQYIKAKSDYNNNQSKMKENDFLHKNELISEDDYRSKKTEFYTSRLAFLEAKENLTHLLKRLDIRGYNLYDLRIEEIDKITQVLNTQGDSQKLQVKAPCDGIVLMPTKNEGGESDATHMGKGDQVKQGGVLALIGDLNGLRIRINVNEFSVNQLKIGQRVKITGSAFPNSILTGEIVAIDRQAQSTQSGVPMFSVEISVPKLTLQDQSIIHVGMSAKIEINIQGENQMTLPINAVFEKNGAAYVKIKQSGQVIDRLVKTGQTTLNSIVIEEGLKPGDQIVI